MLSKNRAAAVLSAVGAVALCSGLTMLHSSDSASAIAATAAPAPAAEAPDPALALVGKPAPAFSLPDQTEKIRTLVANKGKWVVLAFYPADMTRG